MPPRNFDVLIATDFRRHGGTASVAQEVEVQARMGLKTGIIQIDSDDVRSSWAERIQSLVGARLVEVVSARQPVTARLLVLRHPHVFGQARWTLAARTDHVLMIANRTPEGGARESRYDVSAVQERLAAELGAAPPWAPIGPTVREALVAGGGPGLELTPFDWHDIINVDEWAPRHARTGDRVRPTGVIGRHSRDDARKWPDNSADVLHAYPDDPARPVRILGGATAARKLLGRTPPSWQVLAFGSVAPEEFLTSLDVYVYFHHSGWREASGRAVLEALASGLPVVTHPYLERLFADACIYCEPRQAPGIVGELLRERGRTPNARGIELVRSRYDWEEHRRRLDRYLHPPLSGITRPAARRRRILFATSNGGGMGHLTRLLAIARRLPAEFEPLFLTQSTGLAAVRKLGFWVDYVPSHPASGLSTTEWNEYLRTRVASALRVLRPEALVFDGTNPYKGLRRAMADFPQVHRVWSRRAMWKPIPPERAQQVDEHRAFFDVVFEPGELAAEADKGVTASQRHLVQALEPILLLEEDEILSREEARRELGIAPGSVAALLSLGAGNINRIDLVLAAIAEMLGRDPNVHLVALQSLISKQGISIDSGRLSRLETYPLGRVLRAFDFCIAAPGYNSFHELLANAVPTVFIPNEHTDVDDQVARAEWAARRGVGLMSREDDTDQLSRVLNDMLDPAIRDALGQRCRELPGCGGARQAAAIIAALGDSAPARLAPQPASKAAPGTALTVSPRPAVTVSPRPHPHPLRRALWRLWKKLRLVGKPQPRRPRPNVAENQRPPKREPNAVPGQPRRVLVVANGMPAAGAGVEDLADWVAHRSGAVILASADALPPLSRLGLLVELMTEDSAQELAARLDFAAYSRQKTRALMRHYGCAMVIFWGDAEVKKRWPALFLFGD